MTDELMTLMQELIDEVKRKRRNQYELQIADDLVGIARALWEKAFADRLEGEEMVEKVAQAIRDTDNGENNMHDIAKAALAVVREMVG